MPFEEIEKLADLVVESGISELTLQTESRRITIRRAPGGRAVANVPPESEALTVVADDSGLAPIQVEPPAREWVGAPMVGIFHHAEPPVGIGSRVESGQVVGVIESMKLMNDIRAERNGVVKAVQVEAGMAVEYGQQLFELVDG